ncbi:uncharacterized protein LOC143350707 [Colletes latitarsis]|uniref:uncharacterized protein LOC143342016 n=1 Tax=Colletes latitarsis TaxID=2605962 RepID=UPI004037012A
MPLLVQLVRAHGYQRQIVSEADALTALRKLHPQDSVIGDVPKKRSDDGSLRNTHIHPSPAPGIIYFIINFSSFQVLVDYLDKVGWEPPPSHFLYYQAEWDRVKCILHIKAPAGCYIPYGTQTVVWTTPQGPGLPICAA